MTTPNAELAYAVLDQIDAHPERWDQSVWVDPKDCGTAYCFAGWTLTLTGHRLAVAHYDDMELDGKDAFAVDLRSTASAELGIEEDYREGYDLFAGSNTREDLGRIVAEIFGPRPEPTA